MFYPTLRGDRGWKVLEGSRQIAIRTDVSTPTPAVVSAAPEQLQTPEVETAGQAGAIVPPAKTIHLQRPC